MSENSQVDLAYGAQPVKPVADSAGGNKPSNSFARRATFFNTILLPFILISIFAEFYSNSFLMAFLVDNSKAVQIARESGENSSSMIQQQFADRRLFSPGTQGKIEITQKSDDVKLHIKGEFYTAGIRLLSILLLYFWLRPLFAFIKKSDESQRPYAEARSPCGLPVAGEKTADIKKK